MKKLYYPNCSELVADFGIHDAELIFKILTDLAVKHQWQYDPPLTVEGLERIKKVDKEGSRESFTVMDTKGRFTHLEYGPNGYDDELAYRFDSGCNHADSSQFEFFDEAIQEAGAEIKAYDGGTTELFEEWRKGYYHD